MLDAWLRERSGRPEVPLFLSIRGGKLSRDAIEHLITKRRDIHGPRRANVRIAQTQESQPAAQRVPAEEAPD
jgi:hypothetical protein